MNGVLSCAYKGYLGLTNSGTENLDVVVHAVLAAGTFGIGMGCYVARQGLEPVIRIFQQIEVQSKEYRPITKGFQENQALLSTLAKAALIFTLLNVAWVSWRLNKIGCAHSSI